VSGAWRARGFHVANVPNDRRAGRASGALWTLKQFSAAERDESLARDLGSQIHHLVLERQAAYERARVYRGTGQLVPGSLRDEIAANGLLLRAAIKRYGEATGG
jgi:hypothetical protein